MSESASTHDVIVADNDSIIRAILRSVLSAEGFNVLLAVNGYEVIDFAMHVRASLLIVDYKMPRLDGIKACTEIRKLPGYADTPIIVLTAFDDDTTRESAREAGVTAVLGKPFKPVDLLRVLSDLLDLPAGEQSPYAAPPLVWKRHIEPLPVFGEPQGLAEGRRLLNVFRRRSGSGG